MTANPPAGSPHAPVVTAHLTRSQSAAVGRTRRGRNLAMLGILVALALLFYALAFVKLGHL